MSLLKKAEIEAKNQLFCSESNYSESHKNNELSFKSTKQTHLIAKLRKNEQKMWKK